MGRKVQAGQAIAFKAWRGPSRRSGLHFQPTDSALCKQSKASHHSKNDMISLSKNYRLGLPLLLLSLLTAAGMQNNRDKSSDRFGFEHYVGRFELDRKLAENFVVDITITNGELWIKPSSIDKRRLVRKSADDFYVDGAATPVTFNRDNNGHVNGLTIQLSVVANGKPVTARKILLPRPHLKGNTTFRLKGYPNARVVALAGTFNNWNQSQLLFAKQNDEWICRIDLAPGEYEYKFVIDGDWQIDPGNPVIRSDARRLLNSVLLVKPR